ncbi:DUF3800 domain-containing protein [Corynebacterium hindlerae]|uniref:DUF3800 domain-containing protein n=1 Tax=Corynebacterium hindlerae TaxID=699041 RepID=UPI0031B6A8C4
MVSTEVVNKSTLFVFLDESGDMQFGPKATRHFMITAVCTKEPAVSAMKMQNLKYELLAKGSEDLEFHATNNSKGTRRRVVEVINSIPRMRVHTLWVDKRFTHPKLQKSVGLLGQFACSMGRWIDKVYGNEDIEKVILIFDSVLVGKERDAFLKNIKPAFKKLNLEYRVLFHPVKQDLNGQIADYFSWAFFQFKEHGKPQFIAELSSSHAWDNFDIFQSGKTHYWDGPVK